MNFPRRDDATNKELILTIIEIQGYLSRYGKSHTNWHETLNEVIERLERAERPQRMRGRWEYLDYGGVGNYHCSACRRICINKGDYDFCPHCGADMRGTE